MFNWDCAVILYLEIMGLERYRSLFLLDSLRVSSPGNLRTSKCTHHLKHVPEELCSNRRSITARLCSLYHFSLYTSMQQVSLFTHMKFAPI